MKLKITVHGVSYEVEVEVLDPGEGFPGSIPIPQVRHQPAPAVSSSSAPVTASIPKPSDATPVAVSGSSVNSPISGTVIELKCKSGDSVNEGQVLMVIDAMKMDTSIASPATGKIKSVPIAVGDSVREGQLLVEFE